jgi:type I restriction enzyme S subunit
MPSYCLLESGDILLSLTGNVGRCCLVDTENLLLNQRVAKLCPINMRDWAFVYSLFRQQQMKSLLEEMAKGTAQANLSPIETSNMEFIIPDENSLQNFSIIVTPWLQKLLFNKKSIQTIISMRNTLLPKLMDGEVRVMV